MFSLNTLINAQQDPMYTHYMYNTISINPAYAGSRDALTIMGVHRSQWISFPGAPITQTLSINSPIFSPNVGIGLSIVNDKIGPMNSTSFYLDFSYRIKFEKSYLAFGIKSGFNMVKLGLTSLNASNANDPQLANNLKSNLVPNFGAGVYYYSDKFYFGVSIPKILQSNPFDRSQQAVVEAVRHYFFIAGYSFNLSEDVKFLPTTFVKLAPQSPIEADISANFIFKDKYIAGLMYRTGDAAGILLGYHITPQLLVGYAFDRSLINKTIKYNAGSHEIMIRYDFYILAQKKIRSPRYF